MKKKTQVINKRELLIGLSCLFIGALAVFIYMNTELNTNKKLTKRILSNAIGSMEASQTLAQSCSDAYNTATTCVTNINTCNIEEEGKKLDEYNYKRGQAEEIIDWMSEDMKKIIEETKAKR